MNREGTESIVLYILEDTIKSGFEEKPLLPSVRFKNCPIQTSLGVLGKKWTLLILRDIGF
jgi:DNA-binding HxlR family transcriptional regulator